MHAMTQYPPRPTATREMRLEAAKIIESRLPRDYHGAADDIHKVADEYMDGYEVAKELESSYGWSVDLMIAETLDGYGYEVRKLREAVERAWAAEHNVQPPYPSGTKIREGVIVGVFEHSAATYLVDHGKPNSKLLIRFEHAVPVEA